jgi:laminin, alpha 1/2
MTEIIRESGKKNNEISQQITRLKNNDGRKEIEETLTKVDVILDGVRNTELEVNEISQNVNNLKDKLKELDPEWDSKFGLAEENVAKSLINIRDANSIWNINEPIVEQQNEKFAAWNDSISSKLQELRDKIAKAKHAAESVSSLQIAITI